MAKHLFLQNHTFAEPLPPDMREEIHDWLLAHGITCESGGAIDGKEPGSWYVITKNGFRIYNSGWVVKNHPGSVGDQSLSREGEE